MSLLYVRNLNFYKRQTKQYPQFLPFAACGTVICWWCVRTLANFVNDWSRGRISDWFFIPACGPSPLCGVIAVPSTDGWIPLSTKTKLQHLLVTRATCFFLCDEKSRRRWVTVSYHPYLVLLKITSCPPVISHFSPGYLPRINRKTVVSLNIMHEPIVFVFDASRDRAHSKYFGASVLCEGYSRVLDFTKCQSERL